MSPDPVLPRIMDLLRRIVQYHGDQVSFVRRRNNCCGANEWLRRLVPNADGDIRSQIERRLRVAPADHSRELDEIKRELKKLREDLNELRGNAKKKD